MYEYVKNYFCKVIPDVKLDNGLLKAGAFVFNINMFTLRYILKTEICLHWNSISQKNNNFCIQETRVCFRRPAALCFLGVIYILCVILLSQYLQHETTANIMLVLEILYHLTFHRFKMIMGRRQVEVSIRSINKLTGQNSKTWRQWTLDCNIRSAKVLRHRLYDQQNWMMMMMIL